MASNPEANLPRARAAETPTPQPSETDQPPNSSAHYPPPPPGGIPSTMNYTHPQQGYPVPPPYQGGYPPTAAYNPYYHQDPNAAYYGTAVYSPADEAANSCVRCFCIIMFILLLITLMASIVMFTVVKPEKANFKVESFSVSSFSLVPENKIVSGKWEASVYMDNPSYRQSLYIDRWETSLYHKEDYLATGPFMHSMDLDTKSRGSLHMKMETYNTTASSAVEDMAKEQKEGGNVSFNLRLTLYYSTRNYGWFYHDYKSGTLRVKCQDLKVALPVGTNSGNMPGGSKGCDVSDG